VGVARARTLRLLRAADAFDARLDRFVAMSFLRCCVADLLARNSPLRLRHYRRLQRDIEVRWITLG